MMRFFFLSWVWNILVAFVVGMPCSFVFEVLFMVVCDHILMSCWLRICQLARPIPQVIIDDFPFLIFIDVHVCNRGVMLFGYFCAGCPSPMSFNSMYVPLVNDCHNFATIHIVQISENSFVSHIDENWFLLWSHFVQHLNHQIASAFVNRFSKSFSSSCM